MEKSKRHLVVEQQSNQQRYQQRTSTNDAYNMARIVAVLSYLTLIGWLIAIVLYGKNKSSFTSFHLRQSLGLIITGALLALIPLIGWALNIIVCIAWLFALSYAIQNKEQKVPLLGAFYQEHIDFIK